MTDANPDSILKLFGVALGGGFTVKILDIVYLEIRRRFDRKSTARQFVDDSLDPLLKAADELSGKLRSLAMDDFTTLRQRHRHVEHDFLSLLYLLAHFWGNQEVFRRRGLSISIEQDRRGRKLIAFVRCLESRKVRIIPRSSQRAIGELMLTSDDGVLEPIPFFQFVRRFEKEGEVQRWMEPVVSVLHQLDHTSIRQRLLVYGVVVQSMIDTLDPHHHVSRPSAGYARKLSKKSWRDLKYRIFAEYLTFVRKPERFLGPPKRRP